MSKNEECRRDRPAKNFCDQSPSRVISTNRMQMLIVVLAVPLACTLGCGGAGDDDKPRVEQLRITNMTLTTVTGVRIDGVDIGLTLKPGDTKRVPRTWEPGVHTYSVRFTPPDVEGSTPLWTGPREFEIAADTKEQQLVIHGNVLKDRIDEEQLSKWTTYRFEECKYSIDLPVEPSVMAKGQSVLAGVGGVSFNIICGETRLQTIDTSHGPAEQIDKCGFPASFERSISGNQTVHRLKVLAHGKLYHLVLTGSAEDVAKHSAKFFDSFKIDRE